MNTFLTLFGLSIASPDPGCSYIYGETRGINSTPIGQECDVPDSYIWIYAWIAFALISVIVIAAFVYRKRKGTQKIKE